MDSTTTLRDEQLDDIHRSISSHSAAVRACRNIARQHHATAVPITRETVQRIYPSPLTDMQWNTILNSRAWTHQQWLPTDALRVALADLFAADTFTPAASVEPAPHTPDRDVADLALHELPNRFGFAVIPVGLHEAQTLLGRRIDPDGWTQVAHSAQFQSHDWFPMDEALRRFAIVADTDTEFPERH